MDLLCSSAPLFDAKGGRREPQNTRERERRALGVEFFWFCFFSAPQILEKPTLFFFSNIDNSSSIYKLWTTATRLPTTIAATAAASFSTTCPLQVAEDGDIWFGVVGEARWGGCKRVEAPGDHHQQLGARSSERASVPVVVRVGASLKEKKTQRERRGRHTYIHTYKE
jgi:hypothetical protein